VLAQIYTWKDAQRQFTIYSGPSAPRCQNHRAGPPNTVQALRPPFSRKTVDSQDNGSNGGQGVRWQLSGIWKLPAGQYEANPQQMRDVLSLTVNTDPSTPSGGI